LKNLSSLFDDPLGKEDPLKVIILVLKNNGGKVLKLSFLFFPGGVKKLAPTDPKITYNLGVLASRRGEKNEAINWLEQTINLKPNYETARLALAKIYQQTGEKEKAKEQLEYLLQFINPQNEEAQKLLEGL
jgi:tetratricopeptide (TPR) repeat protein